MDSGGRVVSHLNISSVGAMDGGTYSCTASNVHGSVTHAARLNVYGTYPGTYPGTYSCTASDVHGSVTHAARLIVYGTYPGTIQART